MKKSLIIAIMLMLIFLPFASAGFSDFFKKITGRAGSEPTNVSVQVGNAAPVVSDVQAIPPVTLNAGSTVEVIFNFTARDDNGASTLNDATAQAVFNHASEPLRSSTSCDVVQTTSLTKKYQCAITMQYYDKDGYWSVNASIKDSSGASNDYGENTSTSVNIGLLKYILISPAQINFPVVTTGGLNILSSQKTEINNRGNYNGSIIITSYNLTGEFASIEYIPAENFSASGISTESTVCTTGTILDDEVAKTITSSNLPRGAIANQENITYCLKSVPSGISSQTYSTKQLNQPWIISLP